MKKPKLIYVKWEDAYGKLSFNGSQEDAVKWAEGSQCHIEEIGWLIHETDEYVVLAEDLADFKDSSPNTFRNLTKIMKSLIRKRKVVKI